MYRFPPGRMYVERDTRARRYILQLRHRRAGHQHFPAPGGGGGAGAWLTCASARPKKANRGGSAQPNDGEMEMAIAQPDPVLHYGLDFTAFRLRGPARRLSFAYRYRAPGRRLQIRFSFTVRRLQLIVKTVSACGCSRAAASRCVTASCVSPLDPAISSLTGYCAFAWSG